MARTATNPQSDRRTDTTVLAVSNQKGGVGKTTISINLAGALNHLGADVTFIDIDPQGNATEGLGFPDAYDTIGEETLYHALLEDPTVVTSTLLDHDELRLVPSGVQMFTIENELMTSMRNRERLDRVVDELVADHEPDFVIIDCPPSLNILTDSALLACDGLVIPALAESTSTRAIEILFDQIDTIESEFEVSIPPLALAADRVEEDGESDETMEWFRDVFEPGVPVYEIRKRVALKRAWSAGKSIFQHDEECDMEAVFIEMARDLYDADQQTLSDLEELADADGDGDGDADADAQEVPR